VPEGLRVRVVRGPESFTANDNIAPEEVASFWRGVCSRDHRRNFQPEESAVDPSREIGVRLFRILFGGDVRLAFERARTRAATTGSRLRLRLWLGSPELSALPWELLFDPDRDELLFRSGRDSIVRSLEVASPSRRLETEGPLRILLVKSGPRALPRLDLEAEVAAIRTALAKLRRRGQVEIDVIEPDLTGLVEQLAQHRYHVLHFLGHGGFSPGSGGELYFEDQDRAAFAARHDLFAEVLEHQSLRLVILNACCGAQSRPDNLFTGVAQRAVRSGVPAVIAMQCPVEDRMATLFAKWFYALLQITGRPDEALSLSRQRLSFKGYAVGWAIPVLYLQDSNDLLFDPRHLPAGRPSVRWRSLAIGGILSALLVIAGVLLWRRLPPPKPPPVPSAPTPSPECPSPPGLGADMVFVMIPAGTFRMGVTRGTGDNRPAHEVTISKPFCLGAYEVTQKQYEAVTGANPSSRKGADLPVESVTWEDVERFTSDLNRLDPAAHFRLPTEAQWEYAARGGKAGLYGFGDDESLLPRYGNCLGDGDGYPATSPAGRFQPTRWNLHDMQGNVSEWVQDWYGGYSSEPVSDPAGPPRGVERVRRGGSFRTNAKNCQAVARKSSRPEQALFDLGFRVVRDPSRPRERAQRHGRLALVATSAGRPLSAGPDLRSAAAGRLEASPHVLAGAF
jgi:formylglycine-generating enzyme required for sulfatase activity